MTDNDVASTATPHAADEELSVQQAADRFALSASSLVQRLRLREIEATKVRGPHGDEWRVSAAELEARGYRRRSSPLSAELDREQLRRNLQRLRKALETELQRCAAEQAGLERIQTELRALEEALVEAGSRKSARRIIKQVPHQRSKT